MKSLKFTPELCQQITQREKSATWRLFDDKDLQVGDEIEFVNKETKVVFGHGFITSIKIKTLGSLTEIDWIGHETYASKEEMYATYRSYYGDRVGPQTELKIINFTFMEQK